jgi:hypothetical protein
MNVALGRVLDIMRVADAPPIAENGLAGPALLSA